MTYIADRDALAKALWRHKIARPADEPLTWCVCLCWSVARGALADDERAHNEHVADALIASGAVIDAATLADDEALLERMARTWAGGAWEHRRAMLRKGDITRARGWLRALAAALTERTR